MRWPIQLFSFLARALRWSIFGDAMNIPTVMELSASVKDSRPCVDDPKITSRQLTQFKTGISPLFSFRVPIVVVPAHICIVHWPAAAIPVEVFELIISYLPRAEVKNLRLVCREFETKVSSQYFASVVVPFRSELYSKLVRNEDGELINPASKLFSNSTRIFEDFGPHVRRFALALELEEEALAFPPIKPAQEAVSSFWGVYRWPHENYNRYTDLEGLENTADETEGMKAALRYLTRVSTLGLCCDAGLGFLCGPDQIARNNTILHPVFQSSDWHSSRAQAKSAPIITVGEINESPINYKGRPYRPLEKGRLKVLERMVADAGYTGTQIDEAVDLLLDTEGATLSSMVFDERLSSSVFFHQLERPNIPREQVIGWESSSTDRIFSVAQVASAETKSFALAPASLSRSQKEMLLEMEWAHRAMIQSYVLGIVDNAAEGHFDNVTTLKIAKIPSSHTYIFCRKNFWSALPNLKSVSLGVIADWRRVSKTVTNSVEDAAVSPLAAIDKVFQLLSKFIGTQENIERLHFEWICGGEFAPSSYQRNQYVLPAPVVEFPEMMATAATKEVGKDSRLLRLPYIKHLSFKNCWFAPHILIQELRDFALGPLQTLDLESVSLSGPPVLSALDAQPPQAIQQLNAPAGAIAQAWAAGTGWGPNPTTLNALNLSIDAADNSATDASLDLVQPKWFSWAGIIDQFSPSVKVRHVIVSDGDAESLQNNDDTSHSITNAIPDANRLRFEERSYKLESLDFKTCGYIMLDHPLFTMRNMLPANGLPQFIVNGYQSRGELTGLMQQCKDKLLGRVAPYITAGEDVVLEQVFNLRMGWEGLYDPKIIEHAVADGIEYPGAGRFHGAVKSRQKRDAPIIGSEFQGL